MMLMLLLLMRSLPAVSPAFLSACCPAGNFKGMCKQIDHFPEDTDYEADPSEYFLREYQRNSSSQRCHWVKSGEGAL